MANIAKKDLRREIDEILRDADLNATTAKKVRLQLETKLKCDLTERKKEIDDLVMDIVNSRTNDSENSESEDEGPEDIEPKKATKRSSAAENNSSPKKKKDSSGESDSDDKNRSLRRTSRGGKKKPEKNTKKPRAKKEGGKGKGSGFTRPLKLSPALSALLGLEVAPRHEVVAKVWAIIKERNLYDPKNRQYAICDSELRTVMGIKRFRTFGMLKYLKNHFLE